MSIGQRQAGRGADVSIHFDSGCQLGNSSRCYGLQRAAMDSRAIARRNYLTLVFGRDG